MTSANIAAGRADRDRYGTYYSPGGRILVFALIITAALCTMDRMVLSLVVDPVRQDLGLSETQIGLLQGLSFSLMYSLVGIPLGLLADRIARGKLLAAAVFCWSFGTFFCGFATSFETFFLSRMLVGAGEAALWPVAVSLIGDLVPTRNRGTIIGWVIIGQLMGGSISLIVGGHLLEVAAAGGLAALPLGGMVPWRMLFVIYGLLGSVAIVLLLLGTEPPRTPTDQPQAGSHPLAGLTGFYQFFLRNWKIIGSLYLLTAFVGAVQYSGAAWNVPMLLRRFDHGPQQIGLIMGILMLGAGAFGSLAGGFVTKRTGESPVKRSNLLIGCYCLCIAYSMLVFNPSFVVTLALCGVAGTLIATAGVIKIVIMQDIVPANMLGVATAIAHLFTNLLGATLGPLIVAMLTQHVFEDDKMVGVSLGIVVGVALTAVIVFGFVIKRQIVARYAENELSKSREI